MADRDLGALKINIVADSAGVGAGIKSATDSIGSSMTSLARNLAGAFTVGAVTNAVAGALQYANAQRDAAQAAGIAVEKYQTLNIAARDAGASQEKVSQALYVLAQSRSALVQGGDAGAKMAESFSKLGISANEVVSLAPDRLLERIGAALADPNAGAEQFAATLDILGARVGPAFIQALRDIGEQGLDNLSAKFKDSGRIMSDELAGQLDSAQKKLEAFQQRLTVGVGTAAGWVMDKVSDVAAFYGALFSGSSTDEAAKIALEMRGEREAERAGGSEGVNAGGGDLAAAVTAEVNARMAAENKLADSRLSKADQLRKLEEEILELRTKTSDHDGTDLESLRYERQIAEKQLQAEPLRQQIAAEERRAAEAEERQRMARFQRAAQFNNGLESAIAGVRPGAISAADSLASIGGFVGGQTDPMVRAADKQLRVQMKIEEYTRENRDLLLRLVTGGSFGGMD